MLRPECAFFYFLSVAAGVIRHVASDVGEAVQTHAVETNGDSFNPSLSGDGQFVAFQSLASNLDSRCSNGVFHVFVVSLITRQTTCVSLAPDGSPGNGGSELPRINADGRFVAFQSDATNLVAGDTNGVRDVFVHDRQTGQTTLVSVASDGTQANGASSGPALSADGRVVAFVSEATNLVPADTNGASDVFVHDRQTGQTSRASVATDGTQANGASSGPGLNADGRVVAFTSLATNLVAGDTNGIADVFVHDRQTGRTTRVSVASDGSQAQGGFLTGSSLAPAISGDGQVVAFVSSATNLTPGDSDGDFDVFVRDLGAGTTTRVGRRGSMALSEAPALSADGLLVAFAGPPTALGGRCPGNGRQIYAHDRVTGVTLCASPGPAPAFPGGNDDSFEPALSGNGRLLAYASRATNLIAGDTNAAADIVIVGASFSLGVFVATGDLDGDGRAEIITGTGAGVGPLVRVFRADGSDTGVRFNPYGAAFTGGVHVAACDVDGDGRDDIVTGAGAGGGPHVKVFSGGALPALVELASFLAYDPAFRGGVFVACGDVNGDGVPDIITAAGPGGGPHVRVFSGAALPALVELASFLAYDSTFTGGVRVAAGDVDGDGRADIVTAPGPGGGPHIRVFSGRDPAVELASFWAYDPAFIGGVFVAAGDLDGDGRADIVTGADAGGGPHVRAFSGAALPAQVELAGFLAYPPGFTGGAPVAVGNLDGVAALEIVTAAGPGGGPHVRGFSGTGVPGGLGFFVF